MKRANPLSAVKGRDWIQESYETGDPKIRQRTAALKKLGYRAKSFPMGNQVTQWGMVKLTMVDIRPGRSGDTYLENVPMANASRSRNAGPKSIRKTKKYFKTKGSFLVPHLKGPLKQTIKGIKMAADVRRKKNPLPIGKLVRVQARRMRNGTVQIVIPQGSSGRANPRKPMQRKPKAEYAITSAVGAVGPFSTRASATAYMRRIRQSGAVPAGMRITKIAK